MKMFLVHIILLFLFLQIAFVNVAYSQEVQDDFLYKGANIKREMVKCEEHTFVCDTLNNITICIYNSEDKYWGKEQRLVNDTKLTKAMMLGNEKFVIPTVGQWQHLHNIVDNAFSVKMVEQLNGELLLVSIDIHSSDGTIAGVGFMFDKGASYENIPISVYKNIEEEIKNNFIFDLTSNGKEMNYNIITWLQCPRGREDSGLEVPEDGGKLTMPDGKLGDAVGSLGGSAIRP